MRGMVRATIDGGLYVLYARDAVPRVRQRRAADRNLSRGDPVGRLWRGDVYAVESALFCRLLPVVGPGFDHVRDGDYVFSPTGIQKNGVAIFARVLGVYMVDKLNGAGNVGVVATIPDVSERFTGLQRVF